MKISNIFLVGFYYIIVIFMLYFLMSMNLILCGSSKTTVLKTIKAQNSYQRGFIMILYYAS